MRGLLLDTLVMSLILGSEGQRSGTPRLTFWPSPRAGVQTEGGFAGNRLHGARYARRKLGGSISKCAEGGALSSKNGRHHSSVLCPHAHARRIQRGITPRSCRGRRRRRRQGGAREASVR